MLYSCNNSIMSSFHFKNFIITQKLKSSKILLSLQKEKAFKVIYKREKEEGSIIGNKLHQGERHHQKASSSLVSIPIATLQHCWSTSAASMYSVNRFLEHSLLFETRLFLLYVINRKIVHKKNSVLLFSILVGK